jgi:K+-sensing histidine kinase KdpD
MSGAIAEREDALRLLATASDVLSRSLDYDETLGALAKVVVPAIADWCIVDIIDDRGPTRVSVVQADPTKADLAARIAAQHVDTTRSPRKNVLASGEALLVAGVPDPSSTPGITARELENYRDAAAVVDGPSARGAGKAVRAHQLHHRGVRTALRRRRPHPRAGDHAARGLAIEHARLYKQLQESLRARDEFLASAAHELETPLPSIKGYAQTLERRTRELDEPIRARFASLARIDAASTRMARTIDELLDLARLRLGQKIDLDRAVVDLVAVARDSVAEHAPMATGHAVALDARVPSLLGSGMGAGSNT